MRWLWLWTVLGCLVTTLRVSAGDGDELGPEQLPPAVMEHIKEGFGAEPLHARKEVENGKFCYVVTASHRGKIIELYVSPDGAAIARKEEAFSLKRWGNDLASGGFVLLLGLVVVVGAVSRGVVRAANARPLSVPVGWLSACVGSAVGLGLVVFNMATVPRDKDVVGLVASCIVLGAIAASFIEGIVLVLFTSSESVVGRRWWAIGCCVMATVALVLTIPLKIQQIERENRYFKNMTLRPLAD